MQCVYWQLATVTMVASLPSVRDWPVWKSPEGSELYRLVAAEDCLCRQVAEGDCPMAGRGELSLVLKWLSTGRFSVYGG